MNLSDITTIIKEMKGKMPESSRRLLAQKFIKTLAGNLTKDGLGAKVQEWSDSGGVQQFVDECEFLSGLPYVNHDIAVHDTDLATFINKWMNVDEFRRDGEFQPITADMHSLRYTMIEDLKGLARAQERMNEHSDVQRPE